MARLNNKEGHETFEVLPWNEYEPIYYFLKEKINESEYRSDCELPEEFAVIDERYNTKIDLDNEELVKQITILIIEYSIYLEQNDLIELYKCILEIDDEYMLESVIESIMNNVHNINIDNLYTFLTMLYRESCHKRVVIFSIELLGKIRLDDDVIDVLGGHKDFSRSIAFAIIENGIDINDRLVKLASKLTGAYRVPIMKLINNDENCIKDWFLYEGWKGEELDAELGLICAEKGLLLEVLSSRHINKTIIASVSHIINMIMRNDNFKDILSLDNTAELINDYVLTITPDDIDSITFMTLRHIKKFLKDPIGVQTLTDGGYPYGEVQNLINYIENQLLV